MEEAEARIIEIMQQVGIQYYTVTSQIVQGRLADELRVHMDGDLPGETATAAQFQQPTFGLMKELELLVMGETS